MRRHFAGNADTALFRRPNEFHGMRGAHVRDMNMRARHFGKQNVASNSDIFRRARSSDNAQRRRNFAFMHKTLRRHRPIFRMVDDHFAVGVGIFHRAAHEIRAFHIVTVIRKRHGAGECQIAHVA